MRLARIKWFMALVAIGFLVAAVPATAQQAGQDRGGQDRGGPGGRFGGGGGFGGGALNLLQREEVREELELLDDQVKQLTELREKSTAKMRDLFANTRPGGDAGNDRREEMRETFRKFAEETQAEVDKVLLPHQSKRLKQLEAQMRMRGGGVLGALGGDVAQQLGVNEAQQEKLREKARELEADLRKKTNELRKQAQEQLLASLTAEQRAQFKELIGEPFEFKDDGPGGFGFGGTGGGGGQGGGRRGTGGRPQNN